MNYYVYEVTNKINNMKYIGKRSCKCGIEEDYKYLGSGNLITEAVKKHGRDNFTKRIIETLKTNEEAFARERYWIRFYNAVEDNKYYNIKDGGYGNTKEDMKRIQDNMSDEQKKIRSEKLSIANKGEKNCMYGKIGKENPVSRPTVMLSLNGELLKRFECLRETNDYLNKDRSFSFISRVCRNKYGSAYGYLWLFEEDYIEMMTKGEIEEWIKINNEIFEKNKNHMKDKAKETNEKQVYKLDINTYEIIKKYDSIAKANRETNIGESNISRNCRHGSNTAGGFSWIYVDEYERIDKETLIELYKHKYKPVPKECHYKKVVVCTTINKKFESIKEAREYFNLCEGAKIDAVCKGKRKSCGKLDDGTPLEWLYYEDYIKQNKLLIHNDILREINYIN